MYNDESYEQFQKGKSLFIKIAICLCVLGAIIAIFFTGYKQETFLCSKTQNVCLVEKTNLLNIKYRKKIIPLSDITNITYMRQKVKGNRFAIGYTAFILVVKDKKNNPIKVFSTSYFEKDEIDNAIFDLKKQIKNSSDEIHLNRF